jgi:23S rRNA-/tRNA-specific pseudouridylate synthase
MSHLDWIPWGKGVRVLESHAAGLLAVEKPDEILSHPNPNETADADSVLVKANYSFDEEAFHVRDGQGGIRRVYLLNRLDSPTSGVLLLATNPELAVAVKKLFAMSMVSKRYVAIIRGRGLRMPHGTWQDVLTKSRGPGGGVRSAVAPRGVQGNPAVTVYQWDRAGAGNLPLCLVNLEPRTGRTHQLRVQTAHHGHPILGDRTYGDFEFNRALGTSRGFRRLFLHAVSTDLNFDWAGERVKFSATSPIPAEFEAALGGSSSGRESKEQSPSPDSGGTHVSPRLRIRL